jgi:hypothetical protein
VAIVDDCFECPWKWNGSDTTLGIDQPNVTTILLLLFVEDFAA